MKDPTHPGVGGTGETPLHLSGRGKREGSRSWTSSIGWSLAQCLDQNCGVYTINNLDRTNYDGVLPLVEVKYKGVKSDKQVDGAEYLSSTNEWKPTGNNATPPVYSWHFVLKPAIPETYRSYIDIPVDADSLTDDFELTVNLPASDGSTVSFTYLVTQE